MSDVSDVSPNPGMIDQVPAGAWAVGVSGGADSVALLELLRHRSDLRLHVVHLDHETRGGESAADAEFVRELASRSGLACTIARRREIEPALAERLPANRSARFRAVRLELFRRVIAEQVLAGVILAHHADDQAETVMQRLLRGSGPAGLVGMRPCTRVGGVTILRPLLAVRRRDLRELLRARGIGWRDDASNASPIQQRNRVRAVLAGREELTAALIELADACDALVSWLRECAPRLREEFDAADVGDLPPPVAREALRRWLVQRGGGGAVDVPAAATERLLEMVNDRATPSRLQFPGGVLVRRQRGRIFVEKSSALRAGRG
jgi:tRNA(Ile)-lysidine synthase